VILAVDPGLTCGWAVVRPRTGRVVDVGLLEPELDGAIGRSTDRARRIAAHGREFVAVIERHGCTAIAAEQMLCHGTMRAVVPQVLCWGDLIGIAVARGLALYEVVAKDWQHAIADAGGAVDYELVTRRIAALVVDQVGEQLAVIAPRKRTHVYDAIGVGLYAALARPIRIIGARAAA
jgi:Holliday junction resolvasome RuvABC endonuclease subunit